MDIPNLADIGGKVTFDENLHLALFRTKALDVWNYLEIRNYSNKNTPDGSQRLCQIVIPKNKSSKEAKMRAKNEIDTTRVRLCFQVQFLHILLSSSMNVPINNMGYFNEYCY